MAEGAAGKFLNKDELTTKAAAGAVTGLVYRSTAGPQKALLGAGIGAAAATAFAVSSQWPNLSLSADK